MRERGYDLIVRSGTVVTESGVFSADLAIRGGMVAAFATPGELAATGQELNAAGLTVLPGAIDPHFHAGELQIAYREDFASGTRAAAAGGFTTLIEMPLSVPPVITPALLEAKLAELRRKAVVDCALWGGLVPGNLRALPALREAGVAAFKAFMTTVPEYPRVTDAELYAGMAVVGRLGGLVGVHAENETLTLVETARLQRDGRHDFRATAEARPPEAELAAIHTALALAHSARCPIHLVHTSIPEGIAAVATARRAGQDATVETCPHYLAFSAEDLDRLGPFLKCAPPLQGVAAQEALWRQVLDGTVDMMGSDHTPVALADKAPDRDPWSVPPGIQGIQAVLPFLLTEGVHRRGLPLPALVRLMAGNPARRFGLFPRKGTLSPGSDADLVLVDLEKEWTLREPDLLSKHPWSPYLGMRFRGRVVATLVRGRPVYHEGEIEVEGGYGRWLPVCRPQPAR